MWDLAALRSPPEVFPASGHHAPGVEGFFYAGEPYRGKPTRVFAWYGEPQASAGERVPAMVLVHGGGGTAFAEWVRLWNSRGYAALAMDTCGAIGDRNWCDGNRIQHADAGPRGWGGFDAIDEPVGDQWVHHAVAAVVRGVSHLSSRPRVDAARIGITGVSWGGFLTCLAAGIDDRPACAMPVYGCGFITEDSCWNADFQRLGLERARRWHDLFDPSVHLAGARLPMLWLNGTNDFAYVPSSWQKSYRRAPGTRTVCLKLRMPHAHGGAGENAPELEVFADRHLRGGAGLAHITAAGGDGAEQWVGYEAPFSIRETALILTRSAGPWQERVWESLPAAHDEAGRRVSARIPDDATAWYFNLTDFRGLVVSSEHRTRAD